ncbi:MAG: sensor histidine kinase [Runella sp.]
MQNKGFSISRNIVVVIVIGCIAVGGGIIRHYVFNIELRINLLIVFISAAVLTIVWLLFGVLHQYLNRVLPYERHLWKRLFLQIVVTGLIINLLSFSVFSSLVHVLPVYDLLVKQYTDLAKVVGYTAQFLMVALINVIYFAEYSLTQWRQNATRAALLEKEKAQVQFDNLKNQLNPHFLFNSLTSLDSLIEENPALARAFLQQLSKVFRYVLQHKDKGLVRLQTEVNFIQNYIFLLQTRFGEALKIQFSINEADLERQIAPVTLQILVENAVKHNIISTQQPLKMTIESRGDYLWVVNDLYPKKLVAHSHQQGLQNLQNLYGFLTPRSLVIQKTDTHFIVKIPLL